LFFVSFYQEVRLAFYSYSILIPLFVCFVESWYWDRHSRIESWRLDLIQFSCFYFLLTHLFLSCFLSVLSLTFPKDPERKRETISLKITPEA
jgi:hypothetical protein